MVVLGYRRDRLFCSCHPGLGSFRVLHHLIPRPWFCPPVGVPPLFALLSGSDARVAHRNQVGAAVCSWWAESDIWACLIHMPAQV